MEKKILFGEFNNFLQALSFKKYGSLWGKSCDGYLLILHLRKSQWANKYYLDLGGIFNDEKTDEFSAKIRDIDFVISAEKLVPGLDTTMLDSALDLEISNENHLNNLLSFLKENLISYIDIMSTKEGIKKLYNGGYLKGAMIDAKARQILNL